MEEAVLKYILLPFVAVLGIYFVGSVINQLFGVPAIILFTAVGGIIFFAKFYR